MHGSWGCAWPIRAKMGHYSTYVHSKSSTWDFKALWMLQYSILFSMSQVWLQGECCAGFFVSLKLEQTHLPFLSIQHVRMYVYCLTRYEQQKYNCYRWGVSKRVYCHLSNAYKLCCSSYFGKILGKIMANQKSVGKKSQAYKQLHA